MPHNGGVCVLHSHLLVYKDGTHMRRDFNLFISLLHICKWLAPTTDVIMKVTIGNTIFLQFFTFCHYITLGRGYLANSCVH